MAENRTDIFIVCIEWSDKLINGDNLNRLMAILPSNIQAKLKRFYHAEDSWRSLVGQLLPRYWLVQNQVSLENVRFGTTEYGKPLITQSSSPLTYNVTHDSDMVAIVCGFGEAVGIDVMRVALPRGTTMEEFVEFVSEQLTAREKELVQPAAGDEATRLLRLYRMWTVKEAYTKALGEGLGYEFARIEYDVLNKSITVDGEAPRGWKVSSFVVQHRSDTYVVSTARRLGEDQTIMLHLEDTPDALVNFIELKALAKCLVPQCSE